MSAGRPPEPADAAVERPTRGFVLDAFGGPEVLRLATRETTPPARDQVLVDVEAAGVNFGDSLVRRGEYLRDQPLAMAPGSEVVGRVAAAGADAPLAPGTRVAGWVEAGCGYADRVLVPAHRAYPVAEDLPAAAIAAVFLQGITAHYGVHRFGRVAAGETVLVHAAAGGLGGLSVQLSTLAGARVVATASSPEKRAIAEQQGADAALDSSDPDALAGAIRAATEGRGADVVIDGVSGPLFEPSLQALAVRGRYVIIGAAAQQAAMMDARRLIVRNQSVHGFIVAHISDEDPVEPARALAAMCELVRDGDLTPRYEVVPLEQAVEVHRRIEARQVTGKIVLGVAGTGPGASQ